MPTQRLNYQEAAPKVLQALFALGKALHGTTLETNLQTLVHIRASQINGCAFCLRLHVLEAEAAGEDRKRIDVLTAWRETPAWYTERERAALEWTEALTLVAERGVSDDLYTRASALFNEQELAELTLTVAAINTWNRFNVAFNTSPDYAEAVFESMRLQRTVHA